MEVSAFMVKKLEQILSSIYIFPIDNHPFGLLFCDASEFCGMVRKIFIYTPEEVKKLSPKNKLTVNVRMQSKTDADENGNAEGRSSSMAGSR